MRRLLLGWKYALIVIGLLVLTLLVMDFNDRMAGLKRLSEQKERVVVEVTSLFSTQVALETQIAYATSEAALAAEVRQYWHWIQEGDILVVPLEPPGSTPQSAVIPVITQYTRANWEVWLSLFFDDLP
jgi:hypothetical protein